LFGEIRKGCEYIFLRKDERWPGVAVDEEQGLKDTGQGRSSLASTVWLSFSCF